MRRGGSSRFPGAGPLAAGAMLAALALIIGLASYYLPVVGSVLMLVTPLPAAVAAVRYGTRLAVLTAVVATLIAVPLGGPLAAVFVLSSCVMGVALGHGMARGWMVSRTLLLGAITFALTMALTIVVAVQVLGPATVTSLGEAAAATVRWAAAGARWLGLDSYAEIYESLAPLLQQRVLFFLGVSAVPMGYVWAFVWYGVCAPILRRLGHPVPEAAAAAPVARWGIPPPAGIALLVVLFALILLGPLLGPGTPGVFGAQALLSWVVLALAFQGLGLWAYLITRLGLPAPARRLLIVAACAGAFAHPLLYQLTWYGGMFDLALSYRTRAIAAAAGAGPGRPPKPGARRGTGTVSTQGEEFRRGESVRRGPVPAGAEDSRQEKGK